MPSRRKHIRRKSLRRTKSRRGGVPHTRSGVSHVGRPISSAINKPSAINKRLERLEQLETILKKTLKEEKKKWSDIVRDYQQNGADGYGLGERPDSLQRVLDELAEVQQQIEMLKPKKTYYAPSWSSLTRDDAALGYAP
jgi:hypothetical protein